MHQVVTLRVLLSIQLLVVALSISLDLSGHFAMAGVLGDAQAELLNAGVDASHWLALALLLPLVASMFGIWRGRVWGRDLYTLTMAIGLLLTGSAVIHPLESLLGTVETLANGAMLALMWFSPGALPMATSTHRSSPRAEGGVMDAA